MAADLAGKTCPRSPVVCPEHPLPKRKLDVLTEELRHRRPVVGKPYLGLGLADRGEVVAAGPAAELQVAVACDVLAWLPGNGARRVARENLVRHLVVLVRVVVVVHGHPEDLAWRGQVLGIERLPDPARAVDGGMARRICEYREYRLSGRFDRDGRADGLIWHCGSSSLRWCGDGQAYPRRGVISRPAGQEGGGSDVTIQTWPSGSENAPA